MKRPMYLSFQRGLCFRARPRGHKCLWTLLVDAGFGDLPSMAGVVGLVGPIKLTEMGHLQKVGLLGRLVVVVWGWSRARPRSQHAGKLRPPNSQNPGEFRRNFSE
jgi:hypothetical protein